MTSLAGRRMDASEEMVAKEHANGRHREDQDAPLSILHVAAPAPAGGLERVVEGLARGHAAQGHRVRVLAVVEPSGTRHPFVAALSGSQVEVVPIEVPARGYLREVWSVARHCREFRPDVVHTHGFRPDVVDAFTARLLGLPIVTTVHGSSRMGGATVLYEWLQENVFRWFDGVVAVSEPLVDELQERGVTEERIALIPNAWSGDDDLLDRQEARRDLGIDPETTVIGWVGRMIEAKGPDVFLDSLAHLADLDLTASVVGDGPELEPCRRRARALGLDDRLEFHGFVERAARYFQAFDLFVLSSRTEGTPIALLEAVASGVPVVATRVGGVPEVVGPGEAYLVPAENPAELATAIRSALEDPLERRRRADAAHARLETRYDPAAWLSRYEVFYRKVVRRASGSPP